MACGFPRQVQEGRAVRQARAHLTLSYR